MAIIKKFRIKSYKKVNPAIEFENIIFHMEIDLYLITLILKLTKIQYMEC